MIELFKLEPQALPPRLQTIKNAQIKLFYGTWPVTFAAPRVEQSF